MGMSRGPEQFEPVDYLGVLRRRWWVWTGVAIIGVIGALAYLKVAPKSYTASAAVYVTPTAAGQGNNQVANGRTSGAAVNMDTEVVVVRSTQVAQIAAKMLHSPLSPATLADQVTVTVPPNSQVLQINCAAPKPAAAADCAQAFARAYLQNRDTQSAQSINSQLTTLQKKIAALQKTASGLSAQIASLPDNSTSRAAAQTALNADNNEINQLSSQVTTLTAAAAGNSGGSLISNAVPPPASSPTAPKDKVVLPSGLVAGLIIGLVLAFARDRRDERIRGAHDVERSLDLPVMLTVPPGAQASLASPGSSSGQAFVELAHAVAAELGSESYVVLVAGVSRGTAGSIVAANLAAGLARARVSTVLVCAHPGSAAPWMLLGTHDGWGLSDLLDGVAAPAEVVRDVPSAPGLAVVTPGTRRFDATGPLIAADKIVSQLRSTAQCVVIEVQATEEAAGTFVLAQCADGAIIVVETPRSTRSEAIEAIRRLRLLRTPVLGAVVCIARRRRARSRGVPQINPAQEADPAPQTTTASQATVAPPTGDSEPTISLDCETVRAVAAQNGDQPGRPARPSEAEHDGPVDTAHGS